MHDILLDNSFITTQTIQVVFLNSNQEPFYSDFGYPFFFKSILLDHTRQGLLLCWIKTLMFQYGEC